MTALDRSLWLGIDKWKEHRSIQASMHHYGLPADQVSQHIDAAFALWRRRSAIAWELDLSILVGASVAVTKPPSATEHADLPSKILCRI
jgi:hypothetical protein